MHSVNTVPSGGYRAIHWWVSHGQVVGEAWVRRNTLVELTGPVGLVWPPPGALLHQYVSQYWDRPTILHGGAILAPAQLICLETMCESTSDRPARKAPINIYPIDTRHRTFRRRSITYMTNQSQ